MAKANYEALKAIKDLALAGVHKIGEYAPILGRLYATLIGADEIDVEKARHNSTDFRTVYDVTDGQLYDMSESTKDGDELEVDTLKKTAGLVSILEGFGQRGIDAFRTSAKA